jgi:antitoxin component HigA of HigAB toxin-antitoxin module
MDGHGMSASDLGRLLGNRSLGSAVLRGIRQLGRANIRTICKHFHLGPALVIK